MTRASACVKHQAKMAEPSGTGSPSSSVKWSASLMDRHSPYALVADDDALIRMDACDILKDAGFRCYEAATSEKAAEILGKFGQNVQLLFTDVNMPPGEMTGFDLARLCAQDWPNIGILVASGGVTPGPGDMPEGAAFISKPFTSEVVLEHLRKILPDGRRPERLKNGAD
ncbi:response regulator [Paracoccus benzoatiresistens]|uniref:Response regulator n=1 Tax=Paracoccus benzoatiresistens TaxID=2997341 RepID=A0ABT4JBS6_9RHOB|nr:response regulator [Paracoccus sp. EF6]MCZ0964579.1 response regulator [Paracoccus sp. EF6]